MNIRNTNVKNSKGITLISLIITIIVLIILASISVYSGLSSIKSSRFIEFRSELEMMQTQVDYLNEEYTRLEKNGEDGEAYIQSKGKDLTYSAEEQESFEGAGISDKTNYRYFDKTSIEDLGLFGLKYEFLLSIKDRKVIAIGGLKYNGIIYYTIDQIREVPESGTLERGPVTADNIDFYHIEDTRYKIVITNIQCSKYVAKYTIQYRNVDLGDTFSTVGKLITDKDVSFEVDTEGTYEILITDAAGQTLLKTISVRRYTIKYDANGGEGAPVQQIKIHNKDLTLQTGKPTREGYNFLGWSETKNSTTVQYQPGDTYTKNADTTLYAVWKIKTYTITYNANGGSGAPGNQTKTHGVNITLSTTTPTPSKTGRFDSWNTKADGTGTKYSAGAIYSRNENVTLYAQYIYDVTPPKITTAKAIVVGANRSANIAITITDDNSGIVGYAVTTSNSRPSSFTSVSNTKNLNITQKNLSLNRTYYVWATDAVGNVSSSYSVYTKSLSVGDYVNYTYDSAGAYYLSTSVTGLTSDYSINQKKGLTWRILSLNSNGTIDLMSSKTGVQYRSGQHWDTGNMISYNNATRNLNGICSSHYSNKNLGLTGRSITNNDLYNAFNSSGRSKNFNQDYTQYYVSDFTYSVVGDMFRSINDQIALATTYGPQTNYVYGTNYGIYTWCITYHYDDGSGEDGFRPVKHALYCANGILHEYSTQMSEYIQPIVTIPSSYGIEVCNGTNSSGNKHPSIIRY